MFSGRRPAALSSALFVLAVFAGCDGVQPEVERDLSDIIATDTLTVATRFNSTSYFLYRGQPMGYEYELLQHFGEVGVRDAYDPDQNVSGGARYFQWLENQWVNDIADPDERLRFILASYNVGRGHVQDAQRLAEHHGDDPNRWEDVSHWLLQKSKREVFSLPVVRFGYARGIEPVTYVQKILDRYAHYPQFVSDQPAGRLRAQ